MDDDLDQLLKGLKMSHLRTVMDEELAWAERDGPSYAMFTRRILRREFESQQMRSLENRIRRAGLPERWVLETFPWDRQPGVQRAVIEQLGELDFINRAANLVFIGPTGVGKTGLSIGITLRALFEGRRALFMKAQDLFDAMYSSLADRSSRRMLDRLSGYDLLVIDEMGYLNLRPEQSNLFFKLMEQRYGQKATIINTNLEYEQWYDFLGNKEMVAALLDRLRHRCQTIRIDGPTLRTPEG